MRLPNELGRYSLRVWRALSHARDMAIETFDETVARLVKSATDGGRPAQITDRALLRRLVGVLRAERENATANYTESLDLTR